MPSRGVTRYGGVPLYQSSKTSFPLGPITATDLVLSLFRGRSPAEFFKRTIDFCVANRAIALCFCVSHGSTASEPIVEYDTREGGSKSPSLIITRNTPRRERSISDSVNNPFCKIG